MEASPRPPGPAGALHDAATSASVQVCLWTARAKARPAGHERRWRLAICWARCSSRRSPTHRCCAAVRPAGESRRGRSLWDGRSAPSARAPPARRAARAPGRCSTSWFTPLVMRAQRRAGVARRRTGLTFRQWLAAGAPRPRAPAPEDLDLPPRPRCSRAVRPRQEPPRTPHARRPARRRRAGIRLPLSPWSTALLDGPQAADDGAYRAAGAARAENSRAAAPLPAPLARCGGPPPRAGSPRPELHRGRAGLLHGWPLDALQAQARDVRRARRGLPRTAYVAAPPLPRPTGAPTAAPSHASPPSPGGTVRSVTTEENVTTDPRGPQAPGAPTRLETAQAQPTLLTELRRRRRTPPRGTRR